MIVFLDKDLYIPPAPRSFIRENTSKKRSHDTRNSIRRSEDARVQWSFVGFHGTSDDGKAAANNACCSHSSDCSADDESSAVFGDSANETPDLKYSDARQKHRLEIVVLVQFPPEGLCRGDSQEECRAVESDVFEAVKFFGDHGDRGRDD
jgi:hypothetical protein